MSLNSVPTFFLHTLNTQHTIFTFSEYSLTQAIFVEFLFYFCLLTYLKGQPET